MKLKEYIDLYNGLRTAADINRFCKHGYAREILLNIYSQRVVRETTRRFYEVKGRSKKLLHEWKKGKSLVAIARSLNFPAVMLAHIILRENKLTKKKFWQFISDTDKIPDRRLREELKHVLVEDIVYSPLAMEENTKRGKWGEKNISDWLNERKMHFRTENDLKGKYPKTPDFLLSKPIEYSGTKLHWIESKASFGSPDEMRRNTRKQLKAYKELFGDGVVIYWYGFVEDHNMKMPEGILLADKRFFKDLEHEETHRNV